MNSACFTIITQYEVVNKRQIIVLINYKFRKINKLKILLLFYIFI